MKLLLDENLSLVWGQPPKVIRLKTLNQSRAATLRVLIENRDAITESHGEQSPQDMHEWWQGVTSGRITH